MTVFSQHTGKAIGVGILFVLFFIPSLMVTELVQERSQRRDQVIMEVSDKWSNAQTVGGPVLVVPYVLATTDSVGVTTQRYENVYFLPEEVSVRGRLQTEIRARGIYHVPVYSASLDVQGRFDHPNFAALSITPAQVRWDQAFVTVGISDMRGVQNRPHMAWNGLERPFVSGEDVGGLGAGLRSGVAVTERGAQVPFSFTLDLKGSNALAFLPVGKTTTVTLAGNWETPSFDGAFLPESYTLTDGGFEATWNVLDLNRSFPQQWTGNSVSLGKGITSIPPPVDFMDGGMPQLRESGGETGYAFGVRLFQPTDVYTASMRSAKYAMAVIALVFAVVFFIEATGKRRVHPVQYVLIGLALVIFYTLLLSLSEYISFGWAYLLATVAIVGMVTAFVRRVTGNVRRGGLTGGVLTVLYGFIFILLQQEDYTLLIGSIGLFLILAALMWASNRVKWYGGEELKIDN